jgi:hypothetical protein
MVHLPIMFQRLAILAMVTTLLGVGQTVSHDKRNVKRVSPSVQVDQPPALSIVSRISPKILPQLHKELCLSISFPSFQVEEIG